MRLQQFFDTLKRYMKLDLEQSRYYMTNQNFKGGWEVWLQCNVGFAFNLSDLNSDNTTVLVREFHYRSINNPGYPYIKYKNKPFPSAVAVNNKKSASRCDFFINRPNAHISDDTYLEIKCQTSLETINKTWERFAWDIVKMQTITKFNNTINCICLLSYFGPINQNIINSIKAFKKGDTKVRILDFITNVPDEYSIDQLEVNGNSRTIIIGVAIDKF